MDKFHVDRSFCFSYLWQLLEDVEPWGTLEMRRRHPRVKCAISDLRCIHNLTKYPNGKYYKCESTWDGVSTQAAQFDLDVDLHTSEHLVWGPDFTTRRTSADILRNLVIQTLTCNFQSALGYKKSYISLPRAIGPYAMLGPSSMPMQITKSNVRLQGVSNREYLNNPGPRLKLLSFATSPR